MSKIILAAGATALALAAPGLAQQGKGHGQGHAGGHGQQQAKGGKPDKAGGPSVNRGGGQGKAQSADKGRGPDKRPAMAQGRGSDGKPGKAAGKPDRVVERAVRGADARDIGRVFPSLAVAGTGLGLAGGCPPGLAMKNNGCMPPGQYKKVGDPFVASTAQALVGPYSQWYRDNDRYYYRMGDGVLYQVNRSNNLIDALIPYGMRDYSYYPVGYGYPDLYNNYNVPYAYRSFYPDGGDYLYRYGGNAIYAVDPQTQMVSSIVSLLAGDLSVGQPLPSAYNVYNVPMAYRSQYYDSPDAWYRYNDGYIYRVDPTTQLVTAVINALV